MNPLPRRGLVAPLFFTLLAVAMLAAGCFKTAEDRKTPRHRVSDSMKVPPDGTDLGTSGEKQGQTLPPKPTRAELEPRRQAPPPKKTGSHPRPVFPELRRELASQGPREPSLGPEIEKLSGYKTPAEYLIVPSKSFGDGVAVVTFPQDYGKDPTRRYPVVIVFGGAGECARPPRSGALAWMHYYKTDEAVDTLKDNHLEPRDFRELVKPSHLKAFNARLREHPYSGLILVCPYSPPTTPTEGPESPEYEEFIMHELIPELTKRYRTAPGRLGVDGVSMGGARSMYYGLKYPDVFSSIGAIQGAFRPYFPLYRKLVRKNRDALKKTSIQLVTSDGDYLARSVKKMHRLLSARGIPHRYDVLTGPHDYIFNQGPGALSLLIFHNEALNRKPAGPVR